jgi:hypothetical protein
MVQYVRAVGAFSPTVTLVWLYLEMLCSVDPNLRRVASLCRPLTHRDAPATVKNWIY